VTLWASHLALPVEFSKATLAEGMPAMDENAGEVSDEVVVLKAERAVRGQHLLLHSQRVAGGCILRLLCLPEEVGRWIFKVPHSN
jgi:hypothetical protein